MTPAIRNISTNCICFPDTMMHMHRYGAAHRSRIGPQCSRLQGCGAQTGAVGAPIPSATCTCAGQRMCYSGRLVVPRRPPARCWRAPALQTAEAPQECDEPVPPASGYGMTVQDLARFADELAEQARVMPRQHFPHSLECSTESSLRPWWALVVFVRSMQKCVTVTNHVHRARVRS